MSALRRGGAKGGASVSAHGLTQSADALALALESGGEQLPPVDRVRADAVVDKIRQRLGLVGGHTVVALAGATGSGKSSLFNALAGADVATVGALRPTTSTPTAAIWGSEPVGDLLTWLGVSARHHVEGDGPGEHAGSLDGLVLLDLPDFDSRVEAHRVEAERVLELVDLFVWVTDPQKYADARLHDDYVAALATHEAVTIVVLNQVDRLTSDQMAACTADLRRLIERDGVPSATVLGTSATTGAGVDELRQRLANAVASETVARARLAGDVRQSALALADGVASTEVALGAEAERELVDALGRSAGLPTVVDAVERDYRMEAATRTGWPFSRWVHAFRPRPLRRLRLDGDDVRVSEADVRSVLGRSSLPPPSPAARAAVTLATRRVSERASVGLPVLWADAVDAATAPHADHLADALDQAIVGTPLRARSPIWWRVVGWMQLLLAGAAIVGALWLVGLVAAGWLGFVDLTVPTWGPLPIPFVLLVGGLLGGFLLGLLARFVARRGALRRGRLIERRLREAIAVVARREIFEPVSAVQARHRATREALDRAARPPA